MHPGWSSACSRSTASRSGLAVSAKGWLATGAALALVAAAGCVRREIEISSSPAGAQVLLNGRDVGRTPTRVEFTFDGVYDVRLRLDGYDPVVGSGTTQAPVWDFVGADLVAEVFPASLHRVDQWHFELVPEKVAEVDLRARAEEMRHATAVREGTVQGAPPPAGTAGKSAK